MKTLAALLVTLTFLACGAEPGEAGTAESSPYERAVEHYRAGEHAAAEALLTEAIENGKRSAGHYSLLGWSRLVQGDVDGAAEAFDEALRRDGRSADAQTGRGYVALRRGQPARAELAFEAAVEGAPRSGDAWKGLGLARNQTGDPEAARAALRKAVEYSPTDAEARRLLAENLELVFEERRPRAAEARPVPLRFDVRAGKGRFEVRDAGGWKPIFVRGVNLGTALPGSFPAEFPDDYELYRTWFRQMSELGANVVRLYTLHPPSLYRALRDHNGEHDGPTLWLVQGVWTELPPKDDYFDPAFMKQFEAETRRVIDAVHGNLELPPRPGHAHGIYEADVSGVTLAWLLGREWEPYSVDAYNRLRPDKTRFDGEFVRTQSATPIESWLAWACDLATGHETEGYHVQRPVSFTSWPTLDPLHHPTEATVDEEMAIRARLGRPPVDTIREYDNDRVGVDMTRLTATERFPAGLYASYHAYPYYPDFMITDPGYAEARDADGVSRYLGYLKELRQHHGDQPVLIAEVGVPSSRGIAHMHPEGQHHGGHDARSQGEVDVRLMNNIHEAGMAGGVLFAWMDEWFKRNWIVMQYESPAERNPLWLNLLDAEQNYGLLAAWPGKDGFRIVLDGEAGEWSGVPPIYRRGEGQGLLRELRATSDEAWLYLLLEVDRPIGTRDGPEYWIGIDTYDEGRGSRRFPSPVDRTSAVGMEFLIRLSGPAEGRILVDRPYDLFSHRYQRPYRSQPNDRGEFVEIRVDTNRERYGRDGTLYPALGYSRSRLRFGSTDPASADHDSLADWYQKGERKTIELRIPWGLLNVADPSSRQVIHETSARSGVVQTTRTEGFRFHVLAVEATKGGTRVIDAFPAGDAPGAGEFPFYAWPGWERPTYHLRLKESYGIVREGFAGLPD